MILLGNLAVTHKNRDEPWNSVVPVMLFVIAVMFKLKHLSEGTYLTHSFKRFLDNSVSTI
jgi:fumarate reductase subunit C